MARVIVMSTITSGALFLQTAMPTGEVQVPAQKITSPVVLARDQDTQSTKTSLAAATKAPKVVAFCSAMLHQIHDQWRNSPSLLQIMLSSCGRPFLLTWIRS